MMMIMKYYDEWLMFKCSNVVIDNVLILCICREIHYYAWLILLTSHNARLSRNNLKTSHKVVCRQTVTDKIKFYNVPVIYSTSL